MNVRYGLFPAAAILSAALLAGCGGGGSTSNPTQQPADSNSPDGNVTLSGQITYDWIPHSSASNGLDYSRAEQRPVRGATVQLLRSDGSVIATDTADSDGDYSFSVAAGTTVRVRVLAELADFGPGWQVRVVDNTSQDALYALDGSLASSGSSDTVRNLQAESGWGGSSYNSVRAAGPFAILDNVYDSMQLVRSVDPDASFQRLTVNWSEDNRPTQGNEDLGEISTSFFRQSTIEGVLTNEIFILGEENVDTDEYDRHVIVHEWGHYFEASFSRSDTIGGPHSLQDHLDMRVAFSEGWGNAFSAMVLGDSVYRDASGSRQRTGFGFDVDNNNVVNAGWYNESSIQAILYDLFDSGDEANTDTLSLGFEPIYQVLVNQQKDTPLFASIFTFITALKESRPGNAAEIDALVSGQNIVSVGMDAEGSTETNSAGGANHVLPVYTQLPVDGTAVNVCMTDQFGTGNKLSNYRYLKFTVSFQGDYRIRAVRSPVGSVGGDPDIFIYSQGITSDDRIGAGVVVNSETLTVNLPAGDYVMALRDYHITSDKRPRDSVSCYDVTLTTQ